MAATDGFELSPPTKEDLDAAEAAWRDGRLLHEVSAGEAWWRVVRAKSPKQALVYAEVCYASDVNNRFTPVYAGSAIAPAAYAGSTPEIALWEAVLRGIRHNGARRVPQKQTRDRYLVGTRMSRSLKLLNLRRPEITNLVVPGKRPPDLTAAWPAAYATTREWARQLHERLPEIDGFIYESHQVSGNCIVLLQPEPKRRDVFATAGEAQAVSDEPVRTMLRDEARRVKAVIDFGDLPDP